jgi:hypothetical protein
VGRIQGFAKILAFGYVLGVPMFTGGIAGAVHGSVPGIVFAVLGLGALAVTIVCLRRLMGLRARLRDLTPDARRSPVAHLPAARQGAALAARLNGLLAVLSGGVTVWLAVALLRSHHSALALGIMFVCISIPGLLAAVAVSTIAQLRQVVPAGANVGRKLYGVIGALGLLMLSKGVGNPGSMIAGGVVVVICLCAIFLLTKAAAQMRGGTD